MPPALGRPAENVGLCGPWELWVPVVECGARQVEAGSLLLSWGDSPANTLPEPAFCTNQPGRFFPGVGSCGFGGVLLSSEVLLGCVDASEFVWL